MEFLGRIGAFAQRMGVSGPFGWRRRRAARGGTSKGIAQRCIDETLALEFDEPVLFRRWRACQVGHALVHFRHGNYRAATEAALRARLPVARIPETELSREIEGSIEELHARRRLLRGIYRR